MSKKNSVKKSLLDKKISELTLEDIAALEKRLGTAQRPFPMWGPAYIEEDDRPVLGVRLSAISDDANPMRVFSERNYEEVVALAYADMPVPSMLDLFMEGLVRRADPIMRQKALLEGRTPEHENYNRTQFLLGDPGHGKSFMGALMGRLRGAGPVEVFDCGGKNMNDLLFEMVIDFGASEALPKAIDKRLKAGLMEPLSLSLLKGLGEDVFDGQSVDWDKMKTLTNVKANEAYDILRKVSEVEGLDKQAGNSLGMNSQYGPLIRAFLENREIVLDEYNKSREGSDNALQTVIQFLIGEIRECTVDNPLKNKDATSGPSSFTFRREDMGVGFFVTFTGNKTEDGTTTRSLNRSVYDRLKPDTLPDPNEMDWQHRICQMMVGLPVSTLYETFRKTADANPKEFGKWLMWLRETKAKVEGVPVPELQRTLLENWPRLVEGSWKLACLYDRWAHMTNAETLAENGFIDLIEEVDEEYAKKEAMSFRRIKQHLEEAIPQRPRMQPVDVDLPFDAGDWSKPPQEGETIEENAALRFGTRLVEYIESMVYKKTTALGKMNLAAKLAKTMEEVGLRDIHLADAARSSQMSVEQCLNISSFAGGSLSQQADFARKVFCAYLRHLDPGLSARDDDIVTPKAFTDLLKRVSDDAEQKPGTFLIVNSDLESVAEGVLVVKADLEDSSVSVAKGIPEDELTLACEEEDVVYYDDMMASLALPVLGERNLSAIWATEVRAAMAVYESGKDDQGGYSEEDIQTNEACMGVAENKSEYGLGLTTVHLRKRGGTDEDAFVNVHILTNNNLGKTVIVGDSLPSGLRAAFNEMGITHIDREAPDARMKLSSAMNALLRGGPANGSALFFNAFDLHNYSGKVPEKNDDLGAFLIDGLLDKTVQHTHARYIYSKKRA